MRNDYYINEGSMPINDSVLIYGGSETTLQSSRKATELTKMQLSKTSYRQSSSTNM